MNKWHILSWLLSVPVLPPRLRTKIYRLFGMQVDTTARISHGVFIGSRKLTMKSHTFINFGSFLDGSDEIYLGDYVRVGPCVKILTGTHTYNNSVLRRGPGSTELTKPVILERGSWIGMGTIIMPGVSIKEGCIVGAGSVVISSTEPNGLYAGNPAKRIKDLPVN
ncbi:MAG: acetyltransferase [Burkholderiales bacterium PBB4]|nr:MAG: acetyltransferase [Burkholderiales bacterium PBB4]